LGHGLGLSHGGVGGLIGNLPKDAAEDAKALFEPFGVAAQPEETVGGSAWEAEEASVYRGLEGGAEAGVVRIVLGAEDPGILAPRTALHGDERIVYGG
jgi:hypothetical protein